jgi:hypothetical protein
LTPTSIRNSFVINLRNSQIRGWGDLKLTFLTLFPRWKWALFFPHSSMKYDRFPWLRNFTRIIDQRNEKAHSGRSNHERKCRFKSKSWTRTKPKQNNKMMISRMEPAFNEQRTEGENRQAVFSWAQFFSFRSR